jgi:3-deoxy-D-manno-octulosonate 8-phosphate phosphatase (KDO 8-P phosphatase)
MNVLEKFKNIDTFIFDVDGVLTDNSLLVTESGELLRTMNTRDGFAIKYAVEKGFRVCIITGGKSAGVSMRLKALGVQDVFSGINDKLKTFNEYISLNNIDPENILYMGDDLPDHDVMRHVGLSTCPADSAPEIIHIAQYISPLKGGQGCVRDVIEKVLKLQHKWMAFEQ